MTRVSVISTNSPNIRLTNQTCFGSHRHGSTFKQTQYTIATDLRNSTEANVSLH